MNINYSFTKISDDSNIYINNSNKREGIVMLLAEKIFQNVKGLSQQQQLQVIEYIEFIKYKEKKYKEKLMDDFIDNNEEALKELGK